MSYSVNPSAFSSLFAIPTEIVDKHIKLASGNQLKALLIFMKNGGVENIEFIIENKLGISKAEVSEALDYWVSRGLLISDKPSAAVSAEPASAETAASAPVRQHKLDRKALAASKPTREEAIRRMDESEEIRFLFNEVQAKLARPITYGEMSSLVWIHDNQGLPVPVILMAIEYAVRENKHKFAYIEKLCIDWAEREIDTLEKAEQRLNELYMSKTACSIVMNAFGIPPRKPTAAEERYCNRWINEFGFGKELIKLAYDRCVDATSKMSFPYINKILEKWNKAGIKSADEVAEKENKPSGEKKSLKSTSYDINQIKSRFNDFGEE